MTQHSILRKMTKPQAPDVSGEMGGLAEAAQQAALATLGLVVQRRDSQYRVGEIDGGLGGVSDLRVGLHFSDGRTGAIVLSAGCVGAIVEMLTIGRVLAKAPPERKPTQTDYLLALPLLKHMLQLWQNDQFVDVTIGAMADDDAALALRIGGGLCHVYSVELFAARDFTITVIAPQIVTPLVDTAPLKKLNLEQITLTLEAVLCDLTISSRALATLHVGQCLDLPKISPSSTYLKGAGDAKLPVDIGRDGAFRAVRLRQRKEKSPEPASEGFEAI